MKFKKIVLIASLFAGIASVMCPPKKKDPDAADISVLRGLSGLDLQMAICQLCEAVGDADKIYADLLQVEPVREDILDPFLAELESRLRSMPVKPGREVYLSGNNRAAGDIARDLCEKRELIDHVGIEPVRAYLVANIAKIYEAVISESVGGIDKDLLFRQETISYVVGVLVTEGRDPVSLTAEEEAGWVDYCRAKCYEKTDDEIRRILHEVIEFELVKDSVRSAMVRRS